jgi:hypothetical protein
LAVNGLSSKALLYVAHPGTAPPRMVVGSRKSGLAAAPVFLLKAGLTTVDVERVLFVTAGFGETPNALAVDAIRRRLISFILRYFSFLSLLSNDNKTYVLGKLL